MNQAWITEIGSASVCITAGSTRDAIHLDAKFFWAVPEMGAERDRITPMLIEDLKQVV